MSKQRVFSWEFKERVARRMLSGESVSALHHELQIKRSEENGVRYRILRKRGRIPAWEEWGESMLVA